MNKSIFLSMVKAAIETSEKKAKTRYKFEITNEGDHAFYLHTSFNDEKKGKLKKE